MPGRKNRRRKLTFSSFILPVILFIGSMLSGCGGVMHPYDTKFRCPPGYEGLCESMDQAYADSVTGIDPKLFDKKWVKRRLEYEKKHKELFEVRKKAGQKVLMLSDLVNGTGETEKDNAAYSYRKRLFHEMKNILSAPEKPILVPPKVVRALVAPLETPDGEFTTLVAGTYMYVILDKP